MFTLAASTTSTLIAVAVVIAVLVAIGVRLSPTGFSYARNRRRGDPSRRASPDDVVVTLSVVANKLRCTFPQPMSTNGIPAVTATGGAHSGSPTPTSLTVVSATVVDLGYAANVAVGNVIAWPGHDPAIRFRSGAYVLAKNATL